MNDDTIAIALGYGRASGDNNEETTKRRIGAAANKVGKNAITFAVYNGATVDRYQYRHFNYESRWHVQGCTEPDTQFIRRTT